VNVANLLLARGANRVRELAARSALGASRGRLVRQLLTESAVLAVLGAVLGGVLAFVGMRALLAYGAASLPRLEAVPFNLPVFAFALAVLVVATLAIGLLPAVQFSASRIDTLLGASGRTVRATKTTHRSLGLLVIAEVAVAIVLVAGAGWLVRSFDNLQRTDPGFEPRGRLVFDLSLPFQRYGEPQKRLAWLRTLIDTLQQTEGVVAVGTSSGFPMRPDTDATPLVRIEGSTVPPVVSRMRVVSAGFFDAMGIPIRSGRGFTAGDRNDTSPVAVVNEKFVEQYMSGLAPLDTDIEFGFPTIPPESRRPIVGVVGNVRYVSVQTEPEAALYLLQEQLPTFAMSVVVSTRLADPRGLVPAVRDVVQKMDPLLAFDVQPVDALVAETLSRQQLGRALMLAFGVMALALAAIGIYGVIAYASAERRGEVATRMALGATPGDVFWMLVGQGRTLAIAGAALGLVGAYLGGRWASAWLYAVTAADPAVLATALAAVLAVVLVAVVIPAARASRVDLSRALRSE
jgi:putative ABC transport system permease protein